MADDPFEVVDNSGLTDADWAEINKLQQAYKEGGKPALEQGNGSPCEGPPSLHCSHRRIFPQ